MKVTTGRSGEGFSQATGDKVADDQSVHLW
jgi:hypothetical protein